MIIKPDLNKHDYNFSINNIFVKIYDGHPRHKYIEGEYGINFEGHPSFNGEKILLPGVIGTQGRISIENRISEELPMKNSKGIISALIKISNSCGTLLGSIPVDNLKDYLIVINNTQGCVIVVLEE